VPSVLLVGLLFGSLFVAEGGGGIFPRTCDELYDTTRNHISDIDILNL
jgi:hypothetical protein